MNPVFSLEITHATIERIRSQHQDEVSGVVNAVQQVVVELAGAKLLNIEEYSQTSQLQMYLEQAAS